MRRYALRDDQWDRIKDFLPGREGHVGGTAADNRLFVEAVLSDIERACHGAIFRSASAIGKWRAIGPALLIKLERHRLEPAVGRDQYAQRQFVERQSGSDQPFGNRVSRHYVHFVLKTSAGCNSLESHRSASSDFKGSGRSQSRH
jgi:hypothetical protein